MKKQLGINLLKNRRTLSEKDLIREKNILRYSVMVFGGVFVMVVIVMLYQFLLTQKLSKVEEMIAEMTTQIAQHTESSAQQLYLKNRLKLVASFLDARSVAREAIQSVFSIDLPGVVVSGVNFESDNVMSVQFVALDVLSLENLLNYLKQDDGLFVQIVSDGIVRTGEGKYQLQALLTMPTNDGK